MTLISNDSCRSIYADITEHVKFASELEIEHGIRGAGENEISLEFAFIDYLINEPVNLRAGIILIPIGKFNLLHDSPLNDLTDRPLVSQFVIPSTMSETGAGFYGTFYPGRTGKLDYEFYYTTGPCGYDADGTPRVNEENGTNNARQRKCENSMMDLTSITAKRSQAAWPIARCSAWKSPDRTITAMHLLSATTP